MLGEAQEMDVCLGIGRKRRVAALGVLRERARGAFGAEVSRDGMLQFPCRYRGAPHAKSRRCRRPRQIVEHEQVSLQSLDGLGCLEQRAHHEGQHVGRHAPQHAVGQRLEVRVEERVGSQEAEAEGALGHDRAGEPAGLDDPRKQQGVGPDSETGNDASDRAPRCGIPPNEPAEECRSELRDRGKGNKADGSQAVRLAQQQIEQIAEKDDDEDCNTADDQQLPRHVLLTARVVEAPAQEQGDDQAVAHHDGKCHRIDDHHGGGSRQSTNERQQSDELGSGRKRQAENEHVRVDSAPGEQHETGRRDRHDEKVDEHQIHGKQPSRPSHLVFGMVLHHRHVELARQENDADEAEERYGDPEADVEFLGEQLGDLQVLASALDEPRDSAQHGEDDEEADRQEGSELDERLCCNGDDQAVLVLRRIDVTCAKQNRKGGHQERDDQRRVEREQLQLPCPQQGGDGKGDGLELQSEIGKRPGYGDDGDERADRLALAVAGGQKVGDRGNVLALGEPDDAHQELPTQGEKQNGAKIDWDEVVASRCGETDAAEEGPGSAIHGKGERIHQRPAVSALA